MSQGYFVISLDMELMWGSQDKRWIHNKRRNAQGTVSMIPRILDLFTERDIHSTWAIVGLLFCANKKRILSIMPENRPRYIDMKLSSYTHLEQIGEDEHEDPNHYAGTLINLIRETPHQEIGTHTFSNYYCLAEGQTKEQFRQDIAAAIEAAEPYDIVYHSITFPGNQLNPDYLEIIAENSIHVYRGNEQNWIRNAALMRRFRFLQRAINPLDTYLNICGPNCQALAETIKTNNFCEIQTSRVLVPYAPKSGWLELLKIRRIMGQMRYAAQNGGIFHLCLHPHQFGSYLERNIKNLTDILNFYSTLKNAYGFKSMTMKEVAAEAYRIAESESQPISPTTYVIRPAKLM